MLKLLFLISLFPKPLTAQTNPYWPIPIFLPAVVNCNNISEGLVNYAAKYREQQSGIPFFVEDIADQIGKLVSSGDLALDAKALQTRTIAIKNEHYLVMVGMLNDRMDRLLEVLKTCTIQ